MAAPALLQRKAISTGFEYSPRENEALSMGIGWAKPLQPDQDRRAA